MGRAIIQQLVARGDRVRSYSRGDYPQLRELGVEVICGDLRDSAATQEACRGMDVVFHTAALAGIWGRWKDFFEVNTRGTQHVINGCRKHSVPRLVYTSSPSVTFVAGPQKGVDETAPYARRFLAHYPESKARAERQVLKANDDHLMTCALRPHLIWGPGDRHLIPRLLERARRGRLRQVGKGQNLIDITYIDNAVFAHLEAADALERGSPVCGQAYFLSQGEPVNCWQWINQILQMRRLPPVEKKISFPLAWYLGGLLEASYWISRRVDEPPMTRFLAAQLATSHYFNIKRAVRDFGYTPIVSTAEGMRRLGEWLDQEEGREPGQEPGRNRVGAG